MDPIKKKREREILSVFHLHWTSRAEIEILLGALVTLSHSNPKPSLVRRGWGGQGE